MTSYLTTDTAVAQLAEQARVSQGYARDNHRHTFGDYAHRGGFVVTPGNAATDVYTRQTNVDHVTIRVTFGPRGYLSSIAASHDDGTTRRTWTRTAKYGAKSADLTIMLHDFCTHAATDSIGTVGLPAATHTGDTSWGTAAPAVATVTPGKNYRAAQDTVAADLDELQAIADQTADDAASAAAQVRYAQRAAIGDIGTQARGHRAVLAARAAEHRAHAAAHAAELALWDATVDAVGPGQVQATGQAWNRAAVLFHDVPADAAPGRTAPGAAKRDARIELRRIEQRHRAALAAQALADDRALDTATNTWDDEDSADHGCQGHDTTRGAIGSVYYCDGACRPLCGLCGTRRALPTHTACAVCA